MAKTKREKKKAAEAKEKADKEERALTEASSEENLPAHIREDEEYGSELAGLENMDASDLIIPRLVIMQGLSPQVIEGDRSVGEIVNSVTGEVVLGRDEEAHFIPVYHYKEWIQWGDRDSNEGIIDRTMDPDSALAQQGMSGAKGDDGKRIVTEYHNFVVLIPSVSMEFAFIIGCCRTNHSKGRALLALARFRGERPIFAGKYTLSAEKAENKAGQKYFVYGFENAGWADADEYGVARDLYEGVKVAYTNRKIQAHHEEAEATGTESNEKDF